jgi:hypothetical protein
MIRTVPGGWVTQPRGDDGCTQDQDRRAIDADWGRDGGIGKSAARRGNHRILLRSRLSGIPEPGNFIADSVPVRAPAKDEVLQKTIFLSVVIGFPARRPDARG